jgi:hypothetical protein
MSGEYQDCLRAASSHPGSTRFGPASMQIKQVRWCEFVPGPLISGIELDAEEISGVLKYAITNPAMIAARWVENRNGGVDRDRMFHLKADAAGGNVLQNSQFLLSAARFVRPDDLDQIGAKNALVMPRCFLVHTGFYRHSNCIRLHR